MMRMQEKQLIQLHQHFRKYLSSVQHLVQHRTVLSTQSLTLTTLLKIQQALNHQSVIQIWQQRWLSTLTTTSLHRQVRQCLHRLTRLIRVYYHYFSNYNQLIKHTIIEKAFGKPDVFLYLIFFIKS